MAKYRIHFPTVEIDCKAEDIDEYIVDNIIHGSKIQDYTVEEQMTKKIQKIIKDTTTKPKQLDKLQDLYDKYVSGRDELSPSDFCDDSEVKETNVTYNQVRYWLFDDDLIDIVTSEMSTHPENYYELIKDLVDDWYDKGTKE